MGFFACFGGSSSDRESKAKARCKTDGQLRTAIADKGAPNQLGCKPQTTPNANAVALADVSKLDKAQSPLPTELTTSLPRNQSSMPLYEALSAPSDCAASPFLTRPSDTSTTIASTLLSKPSDTSTALSQLQSCRAPSRTSRPGFGPEQSGLSGRSVLSVTALSRAGSRSNLVGSAYSAHSGHGLSNMPSTPLPALSPASGVQRHVSGSSRHDASTPDRVTPKHATSAKNLTAAEGDRVIEYLLSRGMFSSVAALKQRRAISTTRVATVDGGACASINGGGSESGQQQAQTHSQRRRQRRSSQSGTSPVPAPCRDRDEGVGSGQGTPVGPRASGPGTGSGRLFAASGPGPRGKELSSGVCSDRAPRRASLNGGRSSAALAAAAAEEETPTAAAAAGDRGASGDALPKRAPSAGQTPKHRRMSLEATEEEARNGGVVPRRNSQAMLAKRAEDVLAAARAAAGAGRRLGERPSAAEQGLII